MRRGRSHPWAWSCAWLGLLCVLARPAAAAGGGGEVRVGSKLDTESVTLAEMAARLARDAGAPVVRKERLGGTAIAWDALLANEIDLYPEYTGTLTQQILAGSGARTEDDIRRALATRGIGMTRPLGFNNTYAVGMLEEKARQAGIRALSDLRSHGELRFGFSNEFLSRADGWPGLRARYNLPQTDVRGLDHTLAYQALRGGGIDATDLYSTDAEIDLFHLHVLPDDLHYFPDYSAVFVYRADLAIRLPAVVAALKRLEGKLAEADLVHANARVKKDQVSNNQAAGELLEEKMGMTHEGGGPPSVRRQIFQRTLEHLRLVSVSLLAALLVGLPMGVLAAKVHALGQPILALVAVLYTIPSIALLALLIWALGKVGPVPAMVALFFYSLMPIVRNTHAGLVGIAPPLRESAEALGLPAFTRLWRIELPLAARPILAGIKTAAVMNVSTATLGGLIAAGGYGEPIFTGITLFNIGLILQGTIPAAVMALAVQAFFELVERWVIPEGLRQRGASV